MTEDLFIPNRFESLSQAFGGEIRPLIVPIDEDLAGLTRLREQAAVQRGGLIVFLLGPSGIGKTTAVYSAAINMPELFSSVVVVPPEITFRDASGWISVNVPDPRNVGSTLVLFDGREVSDDQVGLRQFLSSLNQFLRRRPDVLFCWPTTNAEWHAQIRDVAVGIGGASLAPAVSDHEVRGPPAGEWPRVLERLLLQFGKTLDDIGMGSDLIGALCAQSGTVGDFLGRVGAIIAERIAAVQTAKRLPRLVFCITSSGDVGGEANRIRRAGTQILAPEPLLGHSPRSEPGMWWTERNRDPNHHLGYIISLFEATLVTATPSAVVYACLHHGEDALKQAALAAEARPDVGNAGRVLETTDLYRFLAGEPIPEFTSSKKGGLSDSTRNAYASIQGMSSRRHKAINEAILGLTSQYVEDLVTQGLEVAYGGDVITDAVVDRRGSVLHLEFHHLSEASCRAASIASYIMDKLRTYAIYHNLIPR